MIWIRRVLVGSGLIIGAGALVLWNWQPHELQQRVLAIAAERVNASTPYELAVGGVSGNFFRSFTIEDVHLRVKGEKSDRITAASIDLRLDWRALLDKKIQIREITVNQPAARVTMDRRRQLVLPPPTPEKKSSASLPFYIDRLLIHDGRLIFRNESLRPPRTTEFPSIEADLSLTPEALSISRLSFALGSGTAECSGRVTLTPPRLVELNLRTRKFPVQELLKAGVALPIPLQLTHSGRWKISGQDARWRVETTGLLDQSRFDLNAELTLPGRYRATLRLDALPISRAWPSPEARRFGVVSARLDASAPQFSSLALNAKGSVRVDGLPSEGPLRNVDLSIDLKRGAGSAATKITATGLQASATSQIALSSRRIDGVYDLEVPDIHAVAGWLPALRDIGGSLVSSGTLRGPIEDLTVDAALEGQKLRDAGKALDHLHATLRGALGSRDRFEVQGALQNLALQADETSPWDIAAAVFSAEGQRLHFAPQVTAHFRNGATLHYAGVFERMPPGWRLSWDKLSLAPTEGPAIAATAPGYASVDGKGRIVIEDLALGMGVGTLHLSGQVVKQKMANVTLAVRKLALEPLMRLLNPGEKIRGTLNADVEASGALDSLGGHVNATLSDGAVQAFSFREMKLSALINSPWITVSSFNIRENSTTGDISGHGKFPVHLIAPSQPNLPVDFTMQAPQLDVHALEELIPGVVIDRGGAAAFKMKVSGIFPDISLDGSLTAQIPRLLVKPAGLELKDLKADIRSHEKTIDVRQFVAKTKKGTITVAGQSTLPNLHFTVQGHNVQLDIPQRLDANFDTALLIGGDIEGPDLSGDVVIRDATYTAAPPKKKEKLKEKSKSGTSTGEPSETSSVWQGTTLDVHGQWPHNVWYREGLSKIETSGNVWVRKKEGTDSIYLDGSLGIVRGTYDVYGKTFVLNSGDLQFTGPPDINPLLNITAQYTSGVNVVYLDLKGSAKEPKLTLRSNPPMSQQDIISVLLFGQPVSQTGVASSTSTSTTQQAQALAGSYLGSLLATQLRESGMDFVGLDVVRVEPSGTGNRLTVGRYVGDKLFVSYGQPIQSGAVRVFDASYYIDPKWTLLGETGSTDSHMDIQFRYPLNQPPAPPPAVQLPPSALGTHS